MASVRIVNASPLILLGKIRRLELLFVGEAKVIVPSTTFGEVTPLPAATSLPCWQPDLPMIGVEPDVPIPLKSSGTLWTGRVDGSGASAALEDGRR